VKVIEEETFDYCTSLSSLVIPGSVETIGKNAFYNLSFYDEDGNPLPHTASALSGHSYAGNGDWKLYRIADRGEPASPTQKQEAEPRSV
jgi:hypothetical protein